ncbi:regulator [Pontibacillus yanchengensis]|uniref:Regulator n=2 Tax=Pontibacillus yanchengensis TaxID=462910 RepID=A0ACC7VEH9_9BACI|nr:BofC C-terminal domain-containing protein [Pontibacillus yanchengensis]MYL33332.1 regulator [Pontibacillus yanchengensis]MYL53381.1 regulator [Pontibacillus yanchengensis]
MKTFRMLFLTLFVVLVAGSISIYNGEASDGDATSQNKSEEKKSWEQDPLELEVVLRRTYVDGQVSEETFTETIWSLEDFWATYDGWNLVEQLEGKVVFQKEVDELSPEMKHDGYFGINQKGELTIFEGTPNHQKAIQSFFYINTEKLESHQTEKLKKGIKIHTKDQYFSLLKTYKQYAVPKY